MDKVLIEVPLLSYLFCYCLCTVCADLKGVQLLHCVCVL